MGAKTAEVFASEGAKLVIAARREGKLREIAEPIRASGGEVTVVPTDISIAAQADALVAKAVEAYGRIDVLLNIAGQMEPGLHPIDDFDDEELNRTIQANLVGTMYITRAATRQMALQGYGNIVTIASVCAINGSGSAVYTATKGALVSLTKHIALRYADRKPTIRANCLCPGTVWTGMVKKELAAQKTYSPKAKEFDSAMGKHTCSDVGISKAAEIAKILLFLASDESACLNGQVIVADYGANL